MFVGQKLSLSLLSEIERASIPAVEIFCARSHFDYRSPTAVQELANWFGNHSVKLHALHAPTSRDLAPMRESTTPISISDPERVRRLDAVDEVKRALEVAEKIPCRYLVQHLGASREGMEPRRLDAAFNSLEHLAMFAKQRGVTIAVENTPGELAAPSNLRNFITDTRLTDLRICLDTGHAHMEGGVGESIEILRNLLVTVHAHDNHGERDEHLFPFEGTIDWEAAMEALYRARGAADGLPIVLELKEQSAGSSPLEQVHAVFDKLEQVAAKSARAGNP